MSALSSRTTGWAVWLLPFAAIAALLAWETDGGRRFSNRPVPETVAAPTPVQVALLPEYKVEGGAEARRETVDRTLFNPTRRPAPPAPQEAAKTRIQRGQFVLTGTAVAGSTTIAFLREANGGRVRSARPGDVVNGMTVAEVRPDRIRFSLGDESEEVVLKVAAGPRTTVQPAVLPPGGPAAAAPVGAPAPGAPAVAQPGQPGAAPATEQTLLERRRAARAAAAAGQTPPPAVNPPQVPQGAPAPQPAPVVPNPAVPAPNQQQSQSAPPADPMWAAIYQRMQQRGP